MTYKEARNILSDKYSDESFYYTEFEQYTAGHNAELQEAFGIAIKALDIADKLQSISHEL